jgi:membrane-bound metal-dependent hydrolase YbcI (DUF457 family)
MNKRDHVLNAVLLSVGTAVLLGVVPSQGLATESVTRPGSESLRALATTVAVECVRFGVPVTLGALFPDVDTAFGRHRKTFHNVFAVAVFVAFPTVFDNLQFVWVGVVAHLLLDFVGSARGIALFYPLTPEEFDLPGGVSTSSRWATPVTVLVTGVELAAMAVVHYYVVPLDVNATDAAQAIGLL